jgi:hypothetical protein
MNVNQDTKEQLELLASVMIKAFAAGLIILAVWIVFSIVGAEAGFAIHERMFGLSSDRAMELNYLCIGIYKIILFSFFLLPYIAIRWRLKSKPMD